MTVQDKNTSETHIGLTENDFRTTHIQKSHCIIPPRKTEELHRTQQTYLSGLLKTATLTTLFHGISFHPVHPTTAQVKDVFSVLERSF